MKKLLFVLPVLVALGGCGTVEGLGRGIRDVGVAAVAPRPVIVAQRPYYRPYYGRGWGRYGRRW